MDCQQALEILDCLAPGGMSDVAECDVADAEAHVAVCPRCAARVRNRRRLDRRIGRTLRAVEIPEGAQQGLLQKIAELESVGFESAEPHSEWIAETTSETISSAGGQSLAKRPDVAVEHANGTIGSPRVTRRRFLRGLALVAACLLVAAIGFYGAVWFGTTRLSVEDVRTELAKIDLESLQALPNYDGDAGAVAFPADAIWQNLAWSCGGVPKGLPALSTHHMIAVYGFALRDKRVGFLAIIPRNQIRDAPTATSLSSAAEVDYISGARIGDAVSVAWKSGNVVCICMIQGGADSLPLLQQLVDAPAA